MPILGRLGAAPPMVMLSSLPTVLRAVVADCDALVLAHGLGAVAADCHGFVVFDIFVLVILGVDEDLLLALGRRRSGSR